MSDPNSAAPLRRFAIFAIVIALATMAMKASAWFLTGSVGLLSDALESGINLSTAFLTWFSVRIARRPPDEEHEYGHEKFEYFASGAIGGLVVAAAVGIAYAAFQRIFVGKTLDHEELGIGMTAAAACLNLWAALVLIREGRRHHSIALEADGRHLMADVWTSVGVIAGVSLVALTGIQILDPLIALGVAATMIVTGLRLFYRSVHGLMDKALPEEMMARVREILDRYGGESIGFHALRSRTAGARSFVSMHVQVPGDWTVQRGHDLLEQIERDIHAVLPRVAVFTHLEPMEDPSSFRDIGFDRPDFKE